jgi:hemoglobin-like flavoprotein
VARGVSSNVLVFESYRRIRRKRFAGRFYELLVASDREIAKRFAHTNFERQESLLMQGVLMLLEYASGSVVAKMAIDRFAASHDRKHYDVRPEMYAIWIDCLVRTASELDDEWTAALELMWREQLSMGIDLMKARY